MHWGAPEHGIAWEKSHAVLKLFGGCIREEEHKDAFCEIYAVFQEAISEYELTASRSLMQRLTPSAN